MPIVPTTASLQKEKAGKQPAPAFVEHLRKLDKSSFCKPWYPAIAPVKGRNK